MHAHFIDAAARHAHLRARNVQRLRTHMMQAVTIYTEAFGTAASGSSAAAPIASLVQSASTGYLHVLRQAVAAHCSVSAVISCPIHCATGPREAQRAWELHGASGFVRGDFGTGELVDTLRQLRADASRHADTLAGFDLLPAIDDVIRGSIRCGRIQRILLRSRVR